MLFFQFAQNEKYVEVNNLLNDLFYNYNEGTLMYYLKKKNFISKLSLDTIGYYKNIEITQLFFYLTNEGLKHADEVIEAIFASLNAIKNSDKLEDIINNLKMILIL